MPQPARYLERDRLGLNRSGMLKSAWFCFKMLAGVEASIGWDGPILLICGSALLPR